MKVGVLATMMAFLLVGGFGLSAQAGPASDCDSDGTLDVLDMCSIHAGSPSTCGFDTDNDGYGNRCDGDFNNDGATDFSDIGPFGGFLGNGGLTPGDMNCDGATDFADIAPFGANLGQGFPGPSGLAGPGIVPPPPPCPPIVPAP